MYQRVIMILLIVQVTAAATEKAGVDAAITHEQADTILSELRAIRTLLEKGRPQPPAPAVASAQEPVIKATLKVDGDPYLGSEDARLTIVEFIDYQCGFCRQFHLTTFPEIRRKYIDTGKVRFVARDLPLDFHNNALLAAEAARCAGDQGQFWTMRDVLITNAAMLAPERLIDYAQAHYLDVSRFRTGLDSHKYKDSVRKKAAEAASSRSKARPASLSGKRLAMQWMG
jgi:protein-disulfide isomerase